MSMSRWRPADRKLNGKTEFPTCLGPTYESANAGTPGPNTIWAAFCGKRSIETQTVVVTLWGELDRTAETQAQVLLVISFDLAIE